MASIKRYQIVSNPVATIRAILPTNEGCNELCTLDDGFTYLSIPDGVDLPDQPEGIVIEDVTLTDALRSSIKAESPLVKLIASRVVDDIRAKYSINDELKLLRTQPSAEFTEYNDYVEECRSVGKAHVAELGL